MSTSDGRNQMLQRHEIVVRIIEANSRRLRVENELNGLDIERRIAERDLSADPNSSTLAARVAELAAKIGTLHDDCRKLEAERDWLDQSLGEFDGAAQRTITPSGRA